MTLLTCKDGLIGDFLGIIPVMIELAKQDNLHVDIHPETEHIFNLIPRKYNIQLKDSSVIYKKIMALDIPKAYEISELYNYYMSQAHFAYLGLPVPAHALKAELEFELTDEPIYDYILAPFSRSLPPEQIWQQQHWQKLVNMMPASSFCVIGHWRDEKNFITGDNVFEMYDKPIKKIINTLKKVKKGLVSVVSGPSHLAYHLTVKNYLITNQTMTWGNNPEAVKIHDYIPELEAESVIEILKNY